MVRTGELAVLLAFVLACATSASAFTLGDPVPMLKRTQFQKMRTPWSDVVGELTPRFAVDKKVDTGSAADFVPYETGYKISFAFDRAQRFAMPWVTVYDSKNILQSLVIRFKYRGHDIQSIEWDTEYALLSEVIDQRASEEGEEGKESDQKSFEIVYQWEEIPELDGYFGLNFLFAASFVFLLLSIGTIVWEAPEVMDKWMGSPSKPAHMADARYRRANMQGYRQTSSEHDDMNRAMASGPQQGQQTSGGHVEYESDFGTNMQPNAAVGGSDYSMPGWQHGPTDKSN